MNISRSNDKVQDGKTLHLPFRLGRWTVERIKELLKERGVSTDQIVAFATREDEHAEMKALTDELAPKGKELDVAPVVNGAEIDGEMNRDEGEIHSCHHGNPVPLFFEIFPAILRIRAGI